MKTYFASNNINALIKIGRASQPEERVKSISGACPFVKIKLELVINGNHERFLHDHYSSNREIGEWFNIITPTLQDLDEIFIKANRTRILVPRWSFGF